VKLCVLGSGSGGNAVLMQSGATRILVDAGFSARTMARRLASIGVDPRSIEAVVVTHEHTDHAKGAAAGAARWGWTIYATSGTQAAFPGIAAAGAQTVSAGANIAIGDIHFTTVSTSHDASEPVAVIATACSTGVRAGIVYDLGLVTETVQRALEHVDILVLESNHDGEMLRNGPYPAMLKRRIAGREGHLSNKAAGVAAAECAHRGMSHVVLAHLSETNNTPAVATEAMRIALRKTPFRGCVVAARQDIPSPAISAERAAAFGPAQLSLLL
jgi:phosphoribosyl 1,2-cyclic phosphodiesterase